MLGNFELNLTKTVNYAKKIFQSKSFLFNTLSTKNL